MISSMTGFGRGEAGNENVRITVEIKTVNNRYLDLNIRMPRAFHAFEEAVRAQIKQVLKRGKADVFVGCETENGAGISVRCNEEIAGQYIGALRDMAKRFQLTDDLALSHIARLPEVFRIDDENADEETLSFLLEQATKDALKQLAAAREKEGAYLASDIAKKLERIRGNVSFIQEHAEDITKEYEKKLRARIEELIGERMIEESRLLTEVAIFADKSSVDEELVRLCSHMDAFSKVMEEESGSADSIGRKLDFIVQEMNREANTILSKSSDMEISARAVEIKTEIEKIREQIQNLE